MLTCRPSTTRSSAPLPQEQTDLARHRCRKTAQKKCRTIDRRTLVAAGFVLLVTTLDDATWPRTDVLALYRCRWQIELVFKRLKSIWHLDLLRARDPEMAQASILCVILAALLAGEISCAAPLPLAAWLDDHTQPLSRWRWEVLWHAAILAAIRGPLHLITLQRRIHSLRRHLVDSPRRRSHHASRARHFLRSHPPSHQPLCA